MTSFSEGIFVDIAKFQFQNETRPYDNKKIVVQEGHSEIFRPEIFGTMHVLVKCLGGLFKNNVA